MNEVFLIGKIITEIEFKFIIKSKDISIVVFKIETIEYKQKIEVKAYNEMADYIYRKFNKNDMIMINGYINNVCEIIIKTVDIL